MGFESALSVGEALAGLYDAGSGPSSILSPATTMSLASSWSVAARSISLSVWHKTIPP